MVTMVYNTGICETLQDKFYIFRLESPLFTRYEFGIQAAVIHVI